MQDLENEHQAKNIGIDRLKAALEKYHEDVKSLEELVGRLEDENLAAKEEHAQQISDLEKQVASERKQRSAIEISASEYESRIRQLEETVEQNRIRACDLMAEVASLEKEHEQALESLEQKANKQTQQYEEDTGILNVRISELTTSLEGSRSEAQRLRQMNEGLEEQLQAELDARDDLLEKWATEQARSFAFMKETVGSERRRAKVRVANWELKSDDLMSDGTTVMGSEPITPVSMTRFVDVEMGRGKNRRRMDSGIGILTEDELLASEGASDLRRGLDSDIDLPTSDLIDL
jgi:chromosome segregation ATPase